MKLSVIHKRRLAFVGILLGAMMIATALILYALGQNVNLYYTPSQLKAEHISPQRTIRIGGLVQMGSIHRSKNDLGVSFVVTDGTGTVPVDYRGILPDLFREEQGVVVQGKLGKNGIFQAQEVLAKHDENYMPPDISNDKQQHHVQAESR